MGKPVKKLVGKPVGKPVISVYKTAHEYAQYCAFLCVLVCIWFNFVPETFGRRKAMTYNQIMWARAFGLMSTDEDYTLFTHLCVRTVLPIAEPIIVCTGVLVCAWLIASTVPYSILCTSIWFTGLLSDDFTNRLLFAGVLFDSVTHRRWLSVNSLKAVQAVLKNLEAYVED